MTKKKEAVEEKQCEESVFEVIGYVVTGLAAFALVMGLILGGYKLYRVDSNKILTNSYLERSMFQCDFHRTIKGFSGCVREYLK